MKLSTTPLQAVPEETSEITMEQAKILAKYYNVSIDYLAYLTDERKPYSKSIIKEK